MQTHFEQELAELKEKLLLMAGHAETAVREALQALLQRDEQLARRVKENDSTIDRFEVEVDENAILLLAKAPLASNLRLIAVAMRISHNLERVGDEASKIAKRAAELAAEPPLRTPIQLQPLADRALALLKDALDAFVNGDPVAARAIIPRDKEIDQLNKDISNTLTALMMSDSQSVPRALSLLVVSKSLERIADHGKNIAEEVVFLCEAEDIRHASRLSPSR